jgi:hypothetical protein
MDMHVDYMMYYHMLRGTIGSNRTCYQLHSATIWRLWALESAI